MNSIVTFAAAVSTLILTSIASAAQPCEEIAVPTVLAVEQLSQRAPVHNLYASRASLLGKVTTAVGANYKWEIVVKNKVSQFEVHYQIQLVDRDCTTQSLKRFQPYRP